MGNSQTDILRAPQFILPSLNDPEKTTSKLARRVRLDLNDLRLLIDNDRPDLTKRNNFRRPDLERSGRGAFTKNLSQRYNISNDEAYDLLKENHQSKIRSTLGNLTVEHSLPAIRLQFPYVCLHPILNLVGPLLNFRSTRRSSKNKKQGRSTGPA